MESLYRKYRPQTFGDVVGQQHVVSTLERAVTEGKTSHAYLFCGPRGTGKTTMARILAKALLCERGPGELPDGTCEECRLIAAGEHPDVYELDAASRTGVDNVRDEIISRVDFAPVRGRYKVYIIDEVHMLTPAAFNALLKTLEEPPAHVVFIMCTTDPQKILATILSRVQRFDFHSIGNDEMRAHLADICEREGFTYEEDALELVCRHARGGMRDAISTLEQLSVFGDGTISLAAARDLLGEVSGAKLSEVSRALAERDVPSLFAEVASLVNAGRDLLQFTRELTSHVRDVYVVSVAGARPGVVVATDDEVAGLAAEASSFGGSDRLVRLLTILGDAANSMRSAVNQRLVLEVAFAKAARPESELTVEALAERVERLEAALAGGAAAGAAPVLAGAGVAAGGPTVAAGGGAPAAGNVPAVASTPAGSAHAASAPTGATATQPAFVPPPLPGRAPVAPCPAASTPAASVPPAPKASVPPVRPVPPAAKLAAAPVAAPVPSAAPEVAVPPALRPASAPQPAPAPRAPRLGTQATPQTPARPAPASVPKPAPNASGPAAATSDPGKLQRTWKALVDALLKKNASCGSLLLNAMASGDDGSTLTVILPKGSAFTCRMLQRTDVKAVVDEAVASVFGPRSVVYVEPSMAGAAAAKVARAQATSPAPAPAPASPEPSQPAPAAPAPKPVPAPSASAPVPAPAASPEPVPAAPASASTMPAPAVSTPAATVPAPPAPSPSAAPKPSPAPRPVPRSAASLTVPPMAAAAPVPPDPADDQVPYGEDGVYLPEDEGFAAEVPAPPLEVPASPALAATPEAQPSAVSPLASADPAPATKPDPAQSVHASSGAAASLKIPASVAAAAEAATRVQAPSEDDLAVPVDTEELTSMFKGVFGAATVATVVEEAPGDSAGSPTSDGAAAEVVSSIADPMAAPADLDVDDD